MFRMTKDEEKLRHKEELRQIRKKQAEERKKQAEERKAKAAERRASRPKRKSREERAIEALEMRLTENDARIEEVRAIGEEVARLGGNNRAQLNIVANQLLILRNTRASTQGLLMMYRIGKVMKGNAEWMQAYAKSAPTILRAICKMTDASKMSALVAQFQKATEAIREQNMRAEETVQLAQETMIAMQDEIGAVTDVDESSPELDDIVDEFVAAAAKPREEQTAAPATIDELMAQLKVN